ncbi:MAG: hypothetical protein LAO05_12235 [Acidobacteriia bacterium]|nr:hypothetical protein [Terriglobia bacterium]
MRVVLAFTSHPLAIGGAEPHTHRLAMELTWHHEVSVISQWSTYRTDLLLGTTVMAPAASTAHEIDGPSHDDG